jgi:uncharacterized delta-60 repeat protein
MNQATDLITITRRTPAPRPAPRRLGRRLCPPLVALAAAIGVAPTHASAQAPALASNPGDLDPSFGTGGKVTTPVAWQSFVEHMMALQPDGKAILAGQAIDPSGDSDVLVVRYTAGGSLDASFGTGGKVVTRLGPGEDLAQSVAVAPDGKIVVAGFTGGSNGADFFALRYLPNGQPDPGFGVGGKVVTDLSGENDVAIDLAIAPDGKIVVAGYTNGAFSDESDIAVVRYTAAGALDPSFGAGGKVFTTAVPGASNAARALTVRPDGKIVVGGYARVDHFGDPTNTDWLLLARYDATGALDATFNGDGLVLLDVDEGEWFSAVAHQPDGKLVAGGTSGGDGINSNSVLVRYLDNGSPDPTFGTGGLDLRAGQGDVSAIALQTAGGATKIITAGSNGDFLLTRRNADGSFDPTFGAGGVVSTDFGGTEGGSALALDGAGKLYAAGISSFPHQFSLARYLVDDASPIEARVIVDSRLYDGPSTSYLDVNKVQNGDTVFIECTARGEPMHGPFGISNVWDRLDSGLWIADAHVLTGSSEPVAPACPAGSEAPPIGLDAYAYDPASEVYNDFGLLFCAHRDTSVSTAAPGLASFVNWLHATYVWPAGSALDGGIFGTGVGYCRGTPSTHNESRALDWGLDRNVPAQRAAAFNVINALLASGDERSQTHALARAIGVQEIIYEDKAWDMRPGNRENGLSIDYDGIPGNGCLTTAPGTPAWTNLHCDHIHFALHFEGANRLTSISSPLPPTAAAARGTPGDRRARHLARPSRAATPLRLPSPVSRNGQAPAVALPRSPLELASARAGAARRARPAPIGGRPQGAPTPDREPPARRTYPRPELPQGAPTPDRLRCPHRHELRRQRPARLSARRLGGLRLVRLRQEAGPPAADAGWRHFDDFSLFRRECTADAGHRRGAARAARPRREARVLKRAPRCAPSEPPSPSLLPSSRSPPVRRSARRRSTKASRSISKPRAASPPSISASTPAASTSRPTRPA